jgi:myosin X
VETIKNVTQICFDVPKLRNEVYCQVVRLTTNVQNPGSQINLFHWYLLATLCSSFLPGRKFLRFLRFHLRRTIDLQQVVGVEVSKIAGFCLETIKRTKSRDFPPSSKEVEAIMSGRGLVCSVTCVGGT